MKFNSINTLQETAEQFGALLKAISECSDLNRCADNKVTMQLVLPGDNDWIDAPAVDINDGCGQVRAWLTEENKLCFAVDCAECGDCFTTSTIRICDSCAHTQQKDIEDTERQAYTAWRNS